MCAVQRQTEQSLACLPTFPKPEPFIGWSRTSPKKPPQPIKLRQHNASRNLSLSTATAYTSYLLGQVELFITHSFHFRIFFCKTWEGWSNAPHKSACCGGIAGCCCEGKGECEAVHWYSFENAVQRPLSFLKRKAKAIPWWSPRFVGVEVAMDRPNALSIR